jgi:predicted ABC-type ATPase
VIAGPNGAGKTTFAREYLPREGGVIHFVNADLIASGLSPLRPEIAARQAEWLVLAELSRLSKERKYLAFESTMSGRTYLRLLSRWNEKGYRIEWFSWDWRPWISRFSALQPVYDKGAMMSHEVMWCVALLEAGTIF